MTSNFSPTPGNEFNQTTALRVGQVSAILTGLMTLITFGFAITAVPISGAYCLENCIEYPYLDSLSQYPKDYLWMYLAIIQLLVYVIFMVSIHANTPQPKKIFSQIGLVFALMAGFVLLADYFIQFAVVPVSLMKGETEGIALLTQYNPHGIFIVLEELGYLLMALSFVFFAPSFSGKSRLETLIRWIFIAGFVSALLALAAVSITYGVAREYRFEVAVISIDWLVLMVNGFLISRLFSKRKKA